MKKYVVLALALTGLLSTSGSAATKKSPYEKFWGKVTAVNSANKSISLHNRKRSEDADFKWDEQTQCSYRKENIRPEKLSVGQLVMVAYVKEDDQNKAKIIAVKDLPNFSKKSSKQP